MQKGSQLAVFLKSLHWSPERLAREINRRYGKGTVSLKAPYGWTKGAFPRGQVPEFVAIILSERLGRTIVISQIWPQRFPATEVGGPDDPGLGPPWAEEHVERILTPLLEQDEHTEATAAPPTYEGEPVPGAVLVSLAVDWLTVESRPAAARSEGVELPTEMLDVLMDRIARLRRLSTGQNCALVLNWVVHELRWALHLTRSASYDAPSGRRLYGAIAELAQLAGWLAEDHGQYVRAQQYLLGALRASDLGGDRNLGAYILSCLGYHLTKSGDEREALRLIKLVDFGMEDVTSGALRSSPSSREAARLHEQVNEGSALVEATGSALWQVGVTGYEVLGALDRDEAGLPPEAGDTPVPAAGACARTAPLPDDLSACGGPRF